jgi:hypothetical protein
MNIELYRRMTCAQRLLAGGDFPGSLLRKLRLLAK